MLGIVLKSDHSILSKADVVLCAFIELTDDFVSRHDSVSRT